MNIFEQASRKSLRFETSKGTISTDALWSLPLTGKTLSLDSIAVDLHNQIEKTATVSFVNRVTNPELEDNKLRLELVLHVIKDKQEEAEKRSAAKVIETERERIREILRNKKDQALTELSEEELTKRLAELGG